MESNSVYQDITRRSGGEIYVGVVGPVRTGKSTFIRRFMQTLVIPNAKPKARSVMLDELPQAAAGKTVMTTELKFVPAKAAKLPLGKGVDASVRLVDCVGYAVKGASGFEEDGKPRLVKTPWQEAPMPFEQAATIGTEKVIKQHSNIGILVTTDGSIAEIPRENYIPAEERAVEELKALEKPFVVLLNCKEPQTQSALRAELEEKYAVPVVAVNAEEMGQDELLEIMRKALFEFPVSRIDVEIPKWLQAFPEDNGAVATLIDSVKKGVCEVKKMRDCTALEQLFDETAQYFQPDVRMDLGEGTVTLTVTAKPELFYRSVSEVCGENVQDDLSLMRYLREVAGVKTEYDKVKDALHQADEVGYGVVYPTETEYRLEKPQLNKKGASYGATFKAEATGYHIVKVDVSGQVSTLIGTKKQSEDFIEEICNAYDNGEESVWDTNIFGRSLRALVNDELSGKAGAISEELRRKMRRVITRVVNDGKGNLFCILF